jgi:hypothetical protein
LLRNLTMLQQATQKQSYAAFLGTNADSIWNMACGPQNRLDEVWSGPCTNANASSKLPRLLL